MQLEKPGWNWEKVYVGHVSYQVEGWTVVVFNDCNQFDYIEYMRSPDGREGDFHGFHENDAIRPEQMLERDEPTLYEQVVQAFVKAR